MKYLKPAVGFHAWNGTPFPATSANYTVNTVLRFQSTITNVGGCYDTASGYFTAPVKGIYYFTFTILTRWISSNGVIEISLYKNGADITSRNLAYDYLPDSTDHGCVECQSTLELNPGDYIYPVVGNLPAGVDVYSGSNLSHFTGHLVRLT